MQVCAHLEMMCVIPNNTGDIFSPAHPHTKQNELELYPCFLHQQQGKFVSVACYYARFQFAHKNA